MSKNREETHAPTTLAMKVYQRKFLSRLSCFILLTIQLWKNLEVHQVLCLRVKIMELKLQVKLVASDTVFNIKNFRSEAVKLS